MECPELVSDLGNEFAEGKVRTGKENDCSAAF
jgi:hypothetical protein